MRKGCLSPLFRAFRPFRLFSERGTHLFKFLTQLRKRICILILVSQFLLDDNSSSAGENCTQTHVHTYSRTHTRTHMHMHLHMLTHVHTRTHTLIIHAPHMPVLTYAQTHAHTLAYTHTRTQTCTHSHAHIDTYMHHTCLYSHMHGYMCTLTHVHTQDF